MKLAMQIPTPPMCDKAHVRRARMIDCSRGLALSLCVSCTERIFIHFDFLVCLLFFLRRLWCQGPLSLSLLLFKTNNFLKINTLRAMYLQAYACCRVFLPLGNYLLIVPMRIYRRKLHVKYTQYN